MNVTAMSGQPSGPNRDRRDHERLRHARDRHSGFSIGRYLQPAPMLFTRDGHNVFLGDMFRGRSAFLVCSGPSLISHDLSLLNSRGIVSLSVNNAATVVRTTLWTSVDNPGNFSEVIWRDPGIIKFVPMCHMEKQFLVRDQEQLLIPSEERVGDMPSVFGYRRNERFNAEQWLYEDTFNWGNHSKVVDADGNKGSRSVMYVALRLLFFLGIRRVFLLGCDFKMEVGKQNYAFPQDRTAASVRGNNSSYHILNTRLQRLLPYFQREQFEIYNCTPKSGLTVFPSISFEKAVENATSDIPKQILTAGMYDRKHERMPKKLPTRPVEKWESKNPKPNNPVIEKCSIKEGSRGIDRGSFGDTAASKKTTSSVTMSGAAPIGVEKSAAKSGYPHFEFTVVTALDETNSDLFADVVVTWNRHKPECRNHGILAACDPSSHKSLVASPTSDELMIRTVSWPLNLRGSQPERRAAGWMHVAAAEVSTEWTLFLSSEVVATGIGSVLDKRWMTPDESGRPPVLIAGACDFSGIVDKVRLWDEWSESIDELKSVGKLSAFLVPCRNSRTRRPPWYLLVQTEWLRQRVDAFHRSVPAGIDERLIPYWATRLGAHSVSVSPEHCGWRYFGDRRRALRRAVYGAEISV